jgi:hypothetical protein
MVTGIHVVFDCADPDRLAKFWMVALEGYDFPSGPPDGFETWEAWADAQGIPEDQRNTGRTLVDKVGGNRPDIFFLKVPESKVVKNRVHLDIKVGQGLANVERRAMITAKVDELTALGAAVAEEFSGQGGPVVLRDLEGNEFCVA